MTDTREMFRTCVCCPNQCRAAMSAAYPLQAESLTPSGLSLIALAVLEGQLPNDVSTRRALERTAEARACVAVCPYQFDIPAAVDRLRAQLASTATNHA